MGSPLFEQLSEIGRRVALAPSLALFLDFDGTLTPLRDTPDLAVLDPGVRRLLQGLAKRENVAVTIISGRGRADLQERVGIPGLFYAGNHGLEISGPGCLFIEPTAVAHRHLLKALADDLAARVLPIAGALVEDKGLTLSLHYRMVEAALGEDLRRIVHSTLAGASHPFQLTMGDMVYEIRPRCSWNKGAAVTWICEQLGKHGTLAICLGDDATDEDAFAALADGITVKVGCSSESVARYHVEGPGDVRHFLQWLTDLLHGQP